MNKLRLCDRVSIFQYSYSHKVTVLGKNLKLPPFQYDDNDDELVSCKFHGRFLL